MEKITKFDQNNYSEIVKEICQNAVKAKSLIANLEDQKRNNILNKVADKIEANKLAILESNQKDVTFARQQGIQEAMIDRLILNEDRVKSMIIAIRNIAKLQNVIGKELYQYKRADGLVIKRASVPIGVLLMIYESRPNVTSDAWALSFKSGNIAILKPGRESFYSSQKILELINECLTYELGQNNIYQMIPIKDRAILEEILKQNEYIDVVIPRGGKSLIQKIEEISKIPIFRHLDGNCHVYIEESAKLDKAIKILVNSKLRRVSVCNAAESLVIDKKIAHNFLPKIVDILVEKGCKIVGDKQVVAIDHRVEAASSDDFYQEYLSKKISVKIVEDINEAIQHINQHNSKHTEAIITENQEKAEQFLRDVDSAILMVNSSTQFSDGGEFGMGAEIGISTGKLHARGPVGIEQLTSYKYHVIGNGHVRE